jgi:hypothetical protein
MTTTTDHAVVADDIEVEAVAAYLRAHPDFFELHPDVLAQMQIPHDAGSAVSLVERQIQTLRLQYGQLLKKYEEVLSIARENEGLSQRLHSLTLNLMSAKDPAGIFDAVYRSMKQDLLAELVSIRLFAAPKDVRGAVRPEFAGPGTDVQRLFKSALAAGQPQCGRLDSAQARALFEKPDEARSGVIVPLVGAGWSGVLVVASSDPRRYYAGMGVDLMAYLGNTIGLVLAPWVAA